MDIIINIPDTDYLIEFQVPVELLNFIIKLIMDAAAPTSTIMKLYRSVAVYTCITDISVITMNFYKNFYIFYCLDKNVKSLRNYASFNIPF